MQRDVNPADIRKVTAMAEAWTTLSAFYYTNEFMQICIHVLAKPVYIYESCNFYSEESLAAGCAITVVGRY